ncbi:hypothetical protein [Acinetobacter bereziniae]|uniref:Uncharacterized protein n=2 Tax=Acinetobacter bereziniae TaxID=106648 RepID=A0A8I1AJL1_ACIBZ|nr:hypothetical protein [Acinetobacter bereziniae]MEC8123860.1 hypothetical protein [Pseudomonadota bacterium]ENV21609.1 hypothetical protein F963_02425 [Acinetobacter bereziniae NIPH 3]MBI0395555.1 hypothetical protein [Acinetobacter bereziniae]QQC82910.1 hypothetical protein I9190_11300 [Acinetobacter bereziniae]UUN96054.1 hypothetical protein I9054_011715 [Acinetobacter bereziniae]
MKIKNLLLLLSLSCTIAYAEISDNDIETIENLSDQVLGNKKLAKLEPQIKAQIKKSQPTVQQLFKAKEIDYNDSVYLHNYAIITSGYAEYLLDQHCAEQSHPIQELTEQAYLALKKRDPKDTIALNNFGLFYAQMSVYYRKNSDPTPRLTYLLKAEQLFETLIQIEPDDEEYQRNYYAVLSDKLMLLYKYHRDIEEQKRLVNILKKPLFEYLSNPEQAFDSGNFIILAQQYYQGLNRENPKAAERWLRDNQQKIETVVNKNRKHTQRENEFLAEFYALLNQPAKALSYLKQLEFSDENSTEPSSFEDEPNLANLRLNPEYQKWFKKYTQDYQEYRKALPEVCKITQLEILGSH